MIIGIICAIVWIALTVITYKTLMKDWKQTTFEKIWLAFFWPCTWIFYGVHTFYNKVYLKKVNS